MSERQQITLWLDESQMDTVFCTYVEYSTKDPTNHCYVIDSGVCMHCLLDAICIVIPDEDENTYKIEWDCVRYLLDLAATHVKIVGTNDHT
jgi:hypothetical protein